MPVSGLDAVFFVDHAPTIDFRSGLFYVCYSIGRNARFEVVMPPEVYAKARLLGAEACAKWQLRGVPCDNIVPMSRKA